MKEFLKKLMFWKQIAENKREIERLEKMITEENLAISDYVDKIEIIVNNNKKEIRLIKTNVKADFEALEDTIFANKKFLENVVSQLYITPKYNIGDMVFGKPIVSRVPNFDETQGSFVVDILYKIEGDEQEYTERQISVLKSKEK